jgi:hypothetical protein
MRDRRQVAARTQPEARVVAAAGAAVGDVDEAAVDGDARRKAAVRILDLDEPEGAVGQDPQDRDLVAAGVGRQEVPAVGRLLESAPPTRTARRCRPPPAVNGDPGIGVSDPSAWRSKPAIVLWPDVLLLT